MCPIDQMRVRKKHLCLNVLHCLVTSKMKNCSLLPCEKDLITNKKTLKSCLLIEMWKMWRSGLLVFIVEGLILG